MPTELRSLEQRSSAGRISGATPSLQNHETPRYKIQKNHKQTNTCVHMARTKKTSKKTWATHKYWACRGRYKSRGTGGRGGGTRAADLSRPRPRRRAQQKHRRLKLMAWAQGPQDTGPTACWCVFIYACEFQQQEHLQP